jgi:uncharacterized protein
VKKLNNIELELDEDLKEKLQWLVPNYSEFRITRQSVDARQRHKPKFVYSVEVAESGEKLDVPQFKIDKLPIEKIQKIKKPIIIGAGPAGLFAALRFVEKGIPCHLFERGSKSEKRIVGINKFWRYGTLDRRNNVCYGEGGAGLYSDGKLITRIKSPHIPYVMHRLVQFGAPEEIQWLSNPHVGSDKIRRVIPKMRQFLTDNGCEIHFDSQVTKLSTSSSEKKITGVETETGQKFESDHVILATGHSAEDMLLHLNDIGVHLDGKSFAMGLRVEHPQSLINKIQYRGAADHPKLGSANYKLTHHEDATNIGVYSFCMCPGGYVLSAGTEPDGIVCNGMSNFNRNSPLANAALVVSINFEKNFSHTLGGLDLRKQIEQSAFQAVQSAGGSKELPTQNLLDFLEGGTKRPLLKSSSPSGTKPIALDKILPDFMTDKLREGIFNFEKKMKGFITDQAQIYGVESRTSCPVRVTRNETTLESISHKGLYPCGEGAGYAGGITSAACDGIKIVDRIIEGL